jgi:hypothetical protein
MDWTEIDASGTPEQTLTNALSVIDAMRQEQDRKI